MDNDNSSNTTPEAETDANGNTVARSFLMYGERYHFDCGECAGEDWQQYDTKQDASYFGVWVNVEKRKIVTFAEGDVTRMTCPDAEHLRAELASMAEFYGPPPPAAVAFDTDGTRTEYFDARPEA